MNIILSIHPKWAKLIYEGKKTVEWRKTIPYRLLRPTDNIYLYETSPVKKVTGCIKMYSYAILNIEDVMTREDGYGMNYIESGCVSIEDLLAYEGKSKALIAWCIGMAKKFNESLDIEDFGHKRPPQSWCYTEVDV